MSFGVHDVRLVQLQTHLKEAENVSKLFGRPLDEQGNATKLKNTQKKKREENPVYNATHLWDGFSALLLGFWYS